MPPAPIRRPLTITAWVLMSVTALALSPLLLAIAAIAAAVTRRPQPVLLVRILASYFARELAVLIACGVLWLASGFGLRMRAPRMQRLHRRLLRWFVSGLAHSVMDVLRIKVAPHPQDEALRALDRDHPLLLFSRHAGPGDTLLLVDQLLDRYRRIPRVVFKDTLTIDPCVDLIGHRLPHAILDTSDPDECEARIEEVSAKLEPRGVLVLFPEGGNFTRERRRSAIRRLWRKGKRVEAQAGREMTHMLPPHPGGALAALRGNPGADVIFAAHTGLGLAAFPRDLWSHPPIGGTLKTQMWVVPAAERPSDPDEQVKWLYAWWKRMDEWVEATGEEPELSQAANPRAPSARTPPASR